MTPKEKSIKALKSKIKTLEESLEDVEKEIAELDSEYWEKLGVALKKDKAWQKHLEKAEAELRRLEGN